MLVVLADFNFHCLAQFHVAQRPVQKLITKQSYLELISLVALYASTSFLRILIAACVFLRAVKYGMRKAFRKAFI